MKLDTFTFERPLFYKKKAEFVYRLKKHVYAWQRKDLDSDWRAFLQGRETILRRCENKMVLDVGCGVGDFLEELKKDYGAASLFGLDVSPAMISEAKKSYPHHDFRVGSCDRLPFGDNSIDVVTFQWVFHHLSPELAKAALTEAKRVCRGEIIVQDTIRHSSGPMRHLSLLYWKMVDGGINYLTKKEWRDFFKTNGLRVVNEHQGKIIRTGIFMLRPVA